MMRLALGPRPSALGLLLLLVSAAPAPRAVHAQTSPPREDGYDLWLRYRQVNDTAMLRHYRAAITGVFVTGDSPTLRVARDELAAGLSGLLGRTVPIGPRTGAVRVRIQSSALKPEGFEIVRRAGGIEITGADARGALYGAFALLRHLQTQRPLSALPLVSAPRISRRILNHWDNLDRSVERGYAGRSLWAWDSLPGTIDRRYVDYARANASLGINGTVLTNVNANARVLTPDYLQKVAALANTFRPYGIRVYLTARFSAPIEIGGLKTADPLDSAVRAWWKDKASEIYRVIPDFGGFLVKANSEGQPGPQDYERSHADGANMLADAVKPHGGIVMWRAFVYSNETPVDRIKQAYDEFKPLDGTFRDNVMVQVKNGPLDFQPVEPFHPLFGAMPRTPLVLELQITKEYLGQDTHLAYMGKYYEEVLDADTHAKGPGSTVARVIDGSLHGHRLTAIAGVANVGTDRDWTGSHFNQANWYAFGRLAWDPRLSSRGIAEEWARMTFGNAPAIVRTVPAMMMTSRDAVSKYMMPLGLTHIFATGHHYGPGAWMNNAGRADWTPAYYHRADSLGLGFDRTATGSNAVAQYHAPVARRYSSRATTPDSLLLWFHRVRWTDPMRSGRSLWNELIHRYDEGVDSVRAMQRAWATLEGQVDSARFADVSGFLAIQEKEARWWRDATLGYFQTFSRMPFPAGREPARPLDFYRRLRCPADRDRPRCPELP
ncbi:MAG TPA: alpha-glucuronidase family glycosyl hydrolase [Gemmatimonadaceae bacterium]|nr:alpha-glucuronidase family glycosyl hydrolase [Gemmatimonadaceae bacterium]